jgi:hypothetical protein
MTFEIGDNFTSKCASKVVEFTKSNPDPAYAVFTNTASASIKIHSAIEDALDSAGLLSDVVLVHGSLSPEEKFHLCRAFCDISTRSKSKSNTKGLVGTSSCDTGLDHLLLLFIILCELPRDLLSYIQRRGRAGRQGEEAKCHLMASFSDYSFTAIQIEASIHSSNGNKHLTTAERAKVAYVKKQELHSMMQFLCLNRGCWHCRIEDYCSRGYLVNANIPHGDIFPPCRTMCPVCCGEWLEYFKPISIQGFIHCMELDNIANAFPIPIREYKSSIVSLFWNNALGIQLIYDRKKGGTIKQYNVQALLMQLFTIGIFEFSDIDKDGNGYIRIVRDPTIQSYYGADGKVIQLTSYMNRYKNFNAYKGLALIHDSKRKTTCYDLLHVQKESTNEINTAE